MSRDRIVEAAAAADNVDTLTMRELARRLGVTHTALYRWVKSRDELFDLISDVLVGRILSSTPTAESPWQTRLEGLAWTIHDEFTALPGYATYLAGPHRHNAGPTRRLRDVVTDAFSASGCGRERANQSYRVFITSLIGWLASQENLRNFRHGAPEPESGPCATCEDDGNGPPFEIFLDSLLRGLPVRELGRQRLNP